MALPPRIAKEGLPPKRTKIEFRSLPRHLQYLRSLDCPIYPGKRPLEAHHLLRADQTRGMGRRAADRYAIPLSRQAHRELHANGDEEAWLAARGVDGRALAAALWRNSGDRDAGLQILWKVRAQASLGEGQRLRGDGWCVCA